MGSESPRGGGQTHIGCSNQDGTVAAIKMRSQCLYSYIVVGTQWGSLWVILLLQVIRSDIVDHQLDDDARYKVGYFCEPPVFCLWISYKLAAMQKLALDRPPLLIYDSG